MRIGIVAPPWVPVPPVGYGGTEGVIDTLARGFRDAGHEVLLVTVPESTCPVPKTSIVSHGDMSRINWSEDELRHVIYAYEQLQDFDIVWDNTLVGPVYSARFPHLQVVMTQHQPADERRLAIYESTADRVPIVAISKAQAAASDALRVERVIHHGVDPDMFEYNKTPDDYFVFLGRMSPNKGVHTAARAAKAAGVKLKIAARLLTDGEGEMEYFKKEVEPLLDDDIQYIGEVSGQAKMDLLRNAKALLNPITWPEPFGLVMIEAMACGTPVISFVDGSVSEIVEDGVTGFYCADEAEMVEKIGQIDQIDRADCRASVENYFCSERMVAEYIDFFEELLSRRTKPAVVRGTVALEEAPVFIDSKPAMPGPRLISVPR